MKVLIIDNNDSFTYNLKHYVNTFCDNIKVLRHYDVNLKIVEDFDKILFSPGPGLPSEYVILYKILLYRFMNNTGNNSCLYLRGAKYID